jgi:hypothetical protein
VENVVVAFFNFFNSTSIFSELANHTCSRSEIQCGSRKSRCIALRRATFPFTRSDCYVRRFRVRLIPGPYRQRNLDSVKDRNTWFRT